MSIDLYTASSRFVFRKGNRDVAKACYSTLHLEILDPEVTPEEARFMRLALDAYVVGEEFKMPGCRAPITLGPTRVYTHKVTLHAAGNPDHNQWADIGPKKTVRVVGIDEAVQAVMVYQSYYEMGGGNCGKTHGVVWELGSSRRKKIGRVCYNGKFVDLKELARQEAKFKAAMKDLDRG